MSIPGFDAETAGNNEEIEMQFAVKTVEHLEAYERLISGIPPRNLKLTPMDNELHENFLSTFPEYASPEALRNLNEDEMKSAKGKERWRNFILPYEKRLKDYNFGTLVRKDSDRGYAEDNSILVTRTQFFAIEIARNRAGLNDKIYQEAQAKKQAS
ncbi:putative polysaccharide biosynthesis protein [Kockovaella imperatae]|uniref:Putative polysaccharide biosynthesis protein n=1 Tax=Kockovaella imperatae TaxID=4999 RepID=A0A1Y1UA26_9TREE|nr:putative polysaccharide biosynthesis protein [Kockovaella imperatae]ORX33935.1 putative polysaccharide biosynthesis protein [Kockovaella imperatae]